MPTFLARAYPTFYAKAPLALLGFQSLSFFPVIFLNVQDGRKRRMCWTHSARRGNFGLWDG